MEQIYKIAIIFILLVVFGIILGQTPPAKEKSPKKEEN
jgi:hypothetical protein